ncbi:DUF1778 domain-containing protein [Methylocapsa polymorpha]|uniref:DUF1778 domain-containing protein n=1 Tax=Methylocapsa polymorpha TaxID=3080828 RepID=A0ABZ0HNM9_9HYPH|nr:DUF1778 domain-containing protein [Methylocapsa sp. RX1]
MTTAIKSDRKLREERLGFRVDEPTKALIERAAQLERRKLTDFCIMALTDAARRTIAEHETLVLSDLNLAAFSLALVQSPRASERLQRAFAEHKRWGSCREWRSGHPKIFGLGCSTRSTIRAALSVA